MSFHFTVSTIRDLTKLSRSLPVISTGKRKRVHRMGKAILATSTVTTISGKSIDPERIYTCYETIPVDHYKNLKRAFLLSGWEGVKIYCDKIHSIELTQKSKQVNKKKYYILMAAGAIAVVILIYWLSTVLIK